MGTICKEITVTAQGKCSLLVQVSRVEVNICALILELLKDPSETGIVGSVPLAFASQEKLSLGYL